MIVMIGTALCTCFGGTQEPRVSSHMGKPPEAAIVFVDFLLLVTLRLGDGVGGN